MSAECWAVKSVVMLALQMENVTVEKLVGTVAVVMVEKTAAYLVGLTVEERDAYSADS